MMIEVSTNTVSILYPDGSSAVFDAAELESRIEKSCLLAGVSDRWIAADIALSVEFALQTQLLHSGAKSVHASEIDSCVISVLEDTGYAAVAEKFLAAGCGAGEFGKVTQAGIPAYLEEKLNLGAQETRQLSTQIVDVMRFIRAEKCSVRLIMELARHFREAAADRLTVSAPQQETILQPSAPEEIAARLPENVRRYADQNILTLQGVSAVFKSVRLDIDLNRLFANSGLTPPVTELVLAPKLKSCADAVDCICKKTQEHCGCPDLPLIITLRNSSDFVKTWMLCEEADSVYRCTKNLSDYFCSMLEIKPFKIFSDSYHKK